MLSRSAYAAAALAAFLATACRPAGGTASGAPAPVIIADEREARLSAALGRHVPVDHLPTVGAFPAPLESAHRALIAAYNQLGIPPNIVDASSGLVAVTEFRVRGAVAGIRASRFLSCGATLTGPRADEDRVVLTVVSRLKTSGQNSTGVETRIVATATDTRGSGSRQACATTGELEARLHEAAKKVLAAGGSDAN